MMINKTDGNYEYVKKVLKKLYDFEPDYECYLRYLRWKEIFLEYNTHTNLTSKKQLPVIFEKHVVDSLAIILLNEFKPGIKLLDIGAGGGFPSLILSVFFPEIHIIALDSIIRKVNFLNLAKTELKLKNFEVAYQKAEAEPSIQADIVTSRAMGRILDVWKLCGHHLKKGGYYVCYKSICAEKEANQLFDEYEGKYKLIGPKFVYYKLPVIENYTRKLVVFRAV